MSSLLSRAKSRKSSSSGANANKHYSAEKHRHSDELLARYSQYGNINKSLIDYFASTSHAELERSKELSKQAAAIPVPFAEGDQFIQEENGFQDMLYKLRDNTRAMAEMHNSFAHTIDNDVLSLLNENKQRIKAHLESLDSDLGTQADTVDKEREASTHALGEYGRSVQMINSGNELGASQAAKSDPFVTHGTVERQLLRQLEHENRLTRSTIHWQQASQTFEKEIVYKIHLASERFTKAQALHAQRLQERYQTMGTQLVSVDTEREWQHFANPEHGRIVDPQTPLRDPTVLAFPDQNHESSRPVKEGLLERKKRHTRNYQEFFMVLTPAGGLLEYPATGIIGDDPKAFRPTLYLYLPDFVLGPPTAATDKKHKFSVEGMRKAASGRSASKGFRKNKEVAWTFKARSHGELMSWWEKIDAIVKSSSTTTLHQTQQRGPSNATVASVGYSSRGSTLETDSYRDTESVLTEREETRSHPDTLIAETPEGSIITHPVGVHDTTATGTEEDHYTDAESEVSEDWSVGGSSVEEEAARMETGKGEHVSFADDSKPSSIALGQHDELESVHSKDAPSAQGLPAYMGTAAYPMEKKSLPDSHTQDSAGSSGWTHDNVSSSASVYSAASAIPYQQTPVDEDEPKPRTSTDQPGTAL